MSLRAGLLTAAALTLCAGEVHAADLPPLVFPAMGSWTVSGEGGRCIMSRASSSENISATVEFELFALARAFEVRVRTNESSKKDDAITAQFTASADGKIIKTPMLTYHGVDGRFVRRWSAARAVFDGLAETQQFTIGRKGERAFQVAVPRFGEARALLDQCAAAIEADLGLGTAEFARIASQPVPPPVSRVVGNDEMMAYFKKASAGDPDDVAISRTLVDARGKPIACGLIHRATADLLNKEACEPLSARYQPAKDKAGNAVPGLFLNIKRWSLRAWTNSP